jgi:hypothetical protein
MLKQYADENWRKKFESEWDYDYEDDDNSRFAG